MLTFAQEVPGDWSQKQLVGVRLRFSNYAAATGLVAISSDLRFDFTGLPYKPFTIPYGTNRINIAFDSPVDISAFDNVYILVRFLTHPNINVYKSNTDKCTGRGYYYADGNWYYLGGSESAQHDWNFAIEWYTITFCSQFEDCETCVYNDCFWYENSCNANMDCTTLNEHDCRSLDCGSQLCHWYNGSCHVNYPTCQELSQNDCEDSQFQCYWYNNQCNPTQGFCDTYNNQSDCEHFGCYWYDGSCHATPQGQLVTCCKCVGPTLQCKSDFPEGTICGEGDASDYKYAPGYKCPETPCSQYANQNECTNAGCYWYAYPNPLGEQSCHDQPWFIAYLPYMAVGIGALIFLAAISSRKKSQPQMIYPYPPPMYQQPPPSPKRK